MATIQNKAIWMLASKKMELGDAPAWPVGEHEVLIKNEAIAINNVDWKIQQKDSKLLNFLDLPAIIGEDVAGTVAEVGSKVTRVSVGDRVLALAGWLGRDGAPQYAAFQRYTLAPDFLVTPLPAHLSSERAAQLPLSIATATQGLFSPAHLHLVRPARATENTRAQESVLVWGGASSVGQCAVQLAARAGYHVVTTASARNHELLRVLGAAEVFDYKDKDIVTLLKSAVHGKWAGAFDAISENGSVEKCAAVIEQGKIATTLPPPSGLREGISAHIMFGADLASSDSQLGKWLFVDYLPWALEHYKIIPGLEVSEVQGGLEGICEGMERLKKGVKGAKVVVLLGGGGSSSM